jgi:hypothetical protein
MEGCCLEFVKMLTKKKKKKKKKKKTPAQPVDKSGTFDVELHGLSTSRQYYLRNTAVLVTELRDDAGNEVRVIDFAPRLELYGRMHR